VALGTPDSHAVGQEWADLTGGAANSGFGVGTGSGNLCGSPGCGDMLDGSAFGLVGTGTNLNQDGLTSRTYIENSITIDITLAAGSPFALSQITSVDFQYGTGSGEGDICSRPIATTTSLKNAVITRCLTTKTSLPTISGDRWSRRRVTRSKTFPKTGMRSTIFSKA
jgi:hypothetical protein